MTTSSITAALPGTASSTSRGQSCPSACAIGHIGPDQRDLVLALQVYVIAGNGLELADAYLIFTNDKYNRGEEVDWNALFHRQDVTDDVISLLPMMPERI